MNLNVDEVLRKLQAQSIGALEKVHQGTDRALNAVHQSAFASLNAVQKSADWTLGAVQRGAHASIEALELLFELKGVPRSVVNGIVGDSLAAQNSRYAIEMEGIGKVKSGRVCIMVHGLCASEASWDYLEDPKKNYGALLAKDLGFSPIRIRYNSGLHISSNGRLLAELLSEIFSNSKKNIREVVFIGHSMGGLVVRSACHYAELAKAPWLKKLKKIFLLGTPHHGNDYEKLGNLTSIILNKVPNLATRIIGRLGNMRSAGIKDLRFGNLIDEDWFGQDPDSLWKDNRHPVPLLPGVDYYVIAGSVAKESNNIFAKYFGDGVVPTHTAAGKSFRKSKSIPFLQKHFKVVKGVSHARLQRHPAVYRQIKKWCEKT